MARRLLTALGWLFLVAWALAVWMSRDSLVFALERGEPTGLDPLAVLATHQDRFVALELTPEPQRGVAWRRYGVPSHWHPVAERPDVLVKTGEPLREAGRRRFAGRLRRFDEVAFSHRIAQRFQKQRGFAPASGTWALCADEPPQVFRPMLLLFVPVTLVWMGVFAAMAISVSQAWPRPSRTTKRPPPDATE